MNKKIKKGCKIIKEICGKIKTERWLLNSVKVCFAKPLNRGDREKIEKLLRKNKLNTVWANSCLLIR